MKGITFPSKEDAREYSAAMRERGWKTLMQYDSATSQWTVLVAEKPEGEAIPTSLRELIQLEEEEEKIHTEPTRKERVKEWGKRTGKRIGIGTGREAKRAIYAPTVKSELEGSLAIMKEHSERTGALDVMAGMKRAIPGTRGAHPRMGIVGVPRITEAGKGVPRISTEPKQPKIARRVPLAETGLGVASEMRFRLFPERKEVTKEKPVAEKGGKE